MFCGYFVPMAHQILINNIRRFLMQSQNQATKNIITINESVFFTLEDWCDLTLEEQQAYLLMRKKNNELLKKAVDKDTLFDNDLNDADLISLWQNATSTNLLKQITVFVNPKDGLRRVTFSSTTLQTINTILFDRFVKAGKGSDFKAFTKCSVSERQNPIAVNLIVRLAKENGDIFQLRQEFTKPSKKYVI